MREELAAAHEERDLDRRLLELTTQARALRERGAMKAADQQAELLSRLSAGLLSPSDVGPALSLLLALTIELVSAFGPTVLSNYAEASDGKQRDKPADLVVDYLAERIEPATNTDRLSESALYADYAAWCRAFGLVAVSAADSIKCASKTGSTSASEMVATGASSLPLLHETRTTGSCRSVARAARLSRHSWLWS